MTILKSMWAVFAGFVVVVVLSMGTDAALGALRIFPPLTHPEAYATWMLALALCYRSFYTILGGYVTAWLAPYSPMRHIYVSMILGGIAGVAGAIGGWSLGNHWYPVALAVTGPFLVWIGGKIRVR